MAMSSSISQIITMVRQLDLCLFIKNAKPALTFLFAMGRFDHTRTFFISLCKKQSWILIALTERKEKNEENDKTKTKYKKLSVVHLQHTNSAIK